MAVAGGLAAVVATSVRHAAAVSMTSSRASAHPARLTNQAAPQPQSRQMAPAVSFSATASHRKAGRGAIMRVAEIVPDLYRLPDIRGVNAYLWKPHPNQTAPGEAILFDCGWPWSGRGLAASLAELGCGPGDLRAIAITHGDFDHVGPLAALAS